MRIPIISLALACLAPSAAAGRRPECAAAGQRVLVRFNLEQAAQLTAARDREGALRHFRLALEFDPADNVAREELRNALRLSARELRQRGALPEAVRRLEECAAMDPVDPEMARETAEARRELEAAARVRERVFGLAALARAGRWDDLRREARAIAPRLAALGSPEQSYVRSSPGFALLPALEAYAAGDSESALALAAAADGSAELARWLRAERRRMWLRGWAAPLAAAYVAVLLGGIFLGLRGIRRASAGRAS